MRSPGGHGGQDLGASRVAQVVTMARARCWHGCGPALRCPAGSADGGPREEHRRVRFRAGLWGTNGADDLRARRHRPTWAPTGPALRRHQAETTAAGDLRDRRRPFPVADHVSVEQFADKVAVSVINYSSDRFGRISTSTYGTHHCAGSPHAYLPTSPRRSRTQHARRAGTSGDAHRGGPSATAPSPSSATTSPHTVGRAPCTCPMSRPSRART